MNTGQSLLTIGALMLLSVIVLGINNKFLSTNSTLYDTKFGVLAVALGTSVIEEASGKPFDLASVDSAITNINLLTAPSGLGAASGEYYPDYNDFDDYNDYNQTITKLPSAIFKVWCDVHYVNPSNPNVNVSTRTWHKKIDVFVTSKSMNNENDTVKLSSIYSYWYFR